MDRRNRLRFLLLARHHPWHHRRRKPGIILGIIVGGSQALTLVAHFRRYTLAWGLHGAAGLIMMIWVFVEIAIILVWSPLHGIYFATGIIQTTLAVLALGAWPHPFLQRTPKQPPSSS